MNWAHERERLEAEYQDLQYLWAEELLSEHPSWEKLCQWELEIEGVEQALAQWELDEDRW